MLFRWPCPEEQAFDINIVRTLWGQGCNLELKLETAPFDTAMTLQGKEQKISSFVSAKEFARQEGKKPCK